MRLDFGRAYNQDPNFQALSRYLQAVCSSKRAQTSFLPRLLQISPFSHGDGRSAGVICLVQNSPSCARSEEQLAQGVLAAEASPVCSLCSRWSRMGWAGLGWLFVLLCSTPRPVPWMWMWLSRAPGSVPCQDPGPLPSSAVPRAAQELCQGLCCAPDHAQAPARNTLWYLGKPST